MTLNLRLESDFLSSYAFTMTGLDIDENAHKLADEFYDSRKLQPIKILIDGSPYAYHAEIAEMLVNFYSLHHIQKDCFLENFYQRLVSLIADF